MNKWILYIVTMTTALFSTTLYSKSITINCYSKHSIDINYKGEKWNEAHDCIGINFGEFKRETFLLYLKDSYRQPSIITGYNKMWSINRWTHIGGALATIYREEDGLEPLILPLLMLGNQRYAVNFTYKPKSIQMGIPGQPVSVLFLSMRIGL